MSTSGGISDSHVKIILMPVRYSQTLEHEFEHLTGLGCHKW
jgi:hypothetical protein